MSATQKNHYVFRIAQIDPWAIRPPSGLNRFDIPDVYSAMTIYVGESREAALAEVLANFRPDLETINLVNSIPSDHEDEKPASGRIPFIWLSKRFMGTALLKSTAKIIDINSAAILNQLRTISDITRYAQESGFTDLDDSAVKSSGANGRTLTQAIATHFFKISYTAIKYGSRLGSPYSCIAGFVDLKLQKIEDSNFILSREPNETIFPDDSALVRVAKIFNLQI